jgi:chromosome segregation protein
MQITSLEISGFKSFGKKVSLTLDSDITGIVGPNGSGKSNVSEAIRFVLGEQSMKSMRGKAGTDLIFKGSSFLPPLGRASVTAIFDNRDKKNNLGSKGEGLFQFLQFDEIRISREIYADGLNEYFINDTKVRLKDVQELLSMVNIGSTGHHMISQGEADRILNASEKERKEMIEDALGLKLYAYRIKEAEKKLEKTDSNLKEGEIARREIAPQMNFLKKQVALIEKRKEQITEISSLYKIYLARENDEIEQESLLLQEAGSASLYFIEIEKLKTLGEKLDQDLRAAREVKEDDTLTKSLEEKHRELSLKREEILRLHAKKEAGHALKVQTLENLTLQKARSTHNGKMVQAPHDKTEEIAKTIEDASSKALYKMGIQEYKESSMHIEHIRSVSRGFFSDILGAQKEETRDYDSEIEKTEVEIELLLKERDETAYELTQLSRELEDLTKNLEEKRKEATLSKDSHFILERSIFENNQKISSLLRSAEHLEAREAALLRKKNLFEEELAEGGALIGTDILLYKRVLDEEKAAEARPQPELRRAIERLKIKLEESGLSNVSDIMREFEEVSHRDAFLAKEIEDLLKTRESLLSLIAESKEKLLSEFTGGVEKINKEFNIFFKQMFGGGEASIILSHKEKRGRKKAEGGEDESLEDLEEAPEEKELESGIEVHVSLPSKKVRDLSMLSGGERALTSIALLFAISGVTPPPFMVLDETDAALDEANARRYGSILKTLAEKSKLIVITHNRETMNQAEALYGVTVGKDGASKVLSVKFDEAAAYAK